MNGLDPQSRACPFCASSLPSAATMCRSCGKFSKPHVIARERRSLLDRFNDLIADWEARHSDTIEGVIARTRRPVQVPPWLRIGAGVVLLLLSTVFIAVWLPPYGGFAAGRAAMAFIATGAALLLGPRLLKEPQNQASVRAPGAPSIVALGFASNVAVAQAAAAMAVIVSAFRAEVDQAAWAAAVVIVLTPLLFRSRAQVPSMIMGAVAGLCLLGLWAVNDVTFSMEAKAYARAIPHSFVPIGALAWTVAAIAIVPQLQLLRIGEVGIGRFKGDVVVRLFGSDVPVSITTSVVLVSLFGTFSQLPYLPSWIGAAVSG